MSENERPPLSDVGGATPPNEPGDLAPAAGADLPDILALLEVLTRHEIDFITVGAVAVAHHGHPRLTTDVDIVPAPTAANLRKLWEALEELEARPEELKEMRPEELPVSWSLEGLLQFGNWDLGTKYGRLDLLQYVVGTLETEDDYKQLRERSEQARYDFGAVSVVGYSDLIHMKTIAGRDHDLIDIRSLEEARGIDGPQA